MFLNLSAYKVHFYFHDMDPLRTCVDVIRCERVNDMQGATDRDSKDFAKSVLSLVIYAALCQPVSSALQSRGLIKIVQRESPGGALCFHLQTLILFDDKNLM